MIRPTSPRPRDHDSAVNQAAPPKSHIAYLVHDLGDAAVARRVAMLQAGGAGVTVAGFRRGDIAPATIAGAAVIDLGQTSDGRLGQRALAVARTLIESAALKAGIAKADVLMARNLEMLVLASRLRGDRRLVYECLDIHRSLLGSGVAARAIQRVERGLLGGVDLVITSSNRFADDYFRLRRRVKAPVLLVENKVLTMPEVVPPQRIAADPPWVIGWFGMLRCRRSLEILTALVQQGQGRIKVVLAGVPAVRELGDLEAHVAGVPGMAFLGRYAAADLAALYGAVHFAWAIDYFEAGLNSAWLLPNRLYEALAHGAVPIALASVETGHWLARNHVGLTIGDGDGDAAELLATMTTQRLLACRNAVDALPPAAVISNSAEMHRLVDAIVFGRLPA